MLIQAKLKKKVRYKENFSAFRSSNTKKLNSNKHFLKENNHPKSNNRIKIIHIYENTIISICGIF